MLKLVMLKRMPVSKTQRNSKELIETNEVMAPAHHTPVLPEEADIERVPKHPNLFLVSRKVDHLPKEDQETTLPMLLLRTLTKGHPGGKTKEIAIQHFAFPLSLCLSVCPSLFLALSLSLSLSIYLSLSLCSYFHI